MHMNLPSSPCLSAWDLSAFCPLGIHMNLLPGSLLQSLVSWMQDLWRQRWAEVSSRKFISDAVVTKEQHEPVRQIDVCLFQACFNLQGKPRVPHPFPSLLLLESCYIVWADLKLMTLLSQPIKQCNQRPVSMTLFLMILGCKGACWAERTWTSGLSIKILTVICKAAESWSLPLIDRDHLIKQHAGLDVWISGKQARERTRRELQT